MKKVTGVLSAMLLASASAAWADEALLLEENGFLVFEAETVPAVGDWQLRSHINGYTGTGYYQWTGPTVLSVEKAGRGTLLYHFRITNPGNYQLRWRSRIAQGSNPTEHNDSWVRFTTGVNVSGEHGLDGWTKAYMNKLNEWAWQAATVDHVGKHIRQYFGAGDHTMEISGRSAGHAIDRIVLYRYDDHQFTEEAFNTAAASPTTRGPVALVETIEASSDTTAQEPTPQSQQPSTQQAASTVSKPDTNTGEKEAQSLLGSCAHSRAVLTPSADLYTQSDRVLNTDELRIELANRTSYLQFDTTQIPYDIESVSLRLAVGSDSGAGVLDVYAADHSDWNEGTTDITSLPTATALVGSRDGQWLSGSTHELPLNASGMSQGKLSFLLEGQNGDSDFSLYSSGSGDNSPQLIFTSNSPDFCARFTDNLALKPQQPDAQAALENTAKSSTDGSGGGSTAIWFAWLLLVSPVLQRKSRICSEPVVSNHGR